MEVRHLTRLLKVLSSKRLVKTAVHANVVGLVFRSSREAQEFGALLEDLQCKTRQVKVRKLRLK